ncbi:ankyrin [Lojkania enalia]|uniref:Ankyrin n=1 Tax=Lojkania enalia TaxID=147567 RepID=A0A9P4JXD0_9PLEO|nr:ankyrin [Didymosphaeria enalia]
MEKLPADLLPPIITHIIHLHLPHPRKTCLTLHSLLDLRLVCHAFSKELEHSLLKHITLPHISLHRTTFHHSPSLTASTCFQKRLLAAALWNSSSTTTNRLLCTAGIQRVNRCLQASSTLPLSLSQAKELRELVCKVAASAPMCPVLFADLPTKLGSADLYCMASMLGLVTWMRGSGTRDIWFSNRDSAIFGSALRCAVVCGRVEAVEYIIREKEWDREALQGIPANIVDAAVEDRNADVLKVLLKEVLHSDKREGREKYGRMWRWYLVRATKIGSVDMLCVLLNSVQAADFRTVRAFIREMMGLKHVVLMYAVRFGQMDVLAWVLENGADVNRPDENGVYPLELALKKGFANVEKMLLENGARIIGSNENKMED